MGFEREDFLRQEELFLAAQELSPDEREKFLQERCPAHLRDKVLRLLANDSSEFPDRPAVSELSPVFVPGQVIDVYRIVRLLGEGGMGTVYEAQRVDVSRRCCIKVIRPGASREFLEMRFRQEINILAQLEHDNIARWTDSRQTADGFAYLVMDYVDGEPIDRYCDRHRLSVRKRLQLFRQICLAVRYAHSKGVVHRDLKPSNIFVETGEQGEVGFGKVKLLDFGIAKLLDRTGDPDSSSTLIFTPNYASPEQLTGETVGRTSDLYALGVVLYLLLTGRLPFERSIAPMEELRQKLAQERVQPPSQAVREDAARDKAESNRLAQLRSTTSQRLVQQLRGDVDSVVLKLLAREKTERYTSADEFLRVIDGYLNKRQPLSRSQLATAIGALLACSLGGFLLWSKLQEPGVPAVKTVAVLPFTNLDADPRDSYFSDGITEDISTQLGKIVGLNVICNEAARRYKDSRKSFREIAAELKVTALVVGSVRRSGKRLRIVSRVIDPQTEAQVWADSFDRLDEDVFAIQAAVATNVARVLKAKLTPQIAERIAQLPTTSLSAYDYYRKGLEYYHFYRREDNERAISLFKKALEQDPDYALAWAGLGDAYAQRVEKFGYSKNWLDYSIGASKKAIALDPDLAEGHKALGLAYLFKGRFRQALLSEEKALALNPNYFMAYNVYAFANGYLGNWDKALKALQKAQLLNPVNPYGFISLAEAYIALGFDDKAEQLLSRAIELQPDIYNGYSQLSYLYLLQGKQEAALKQAKNCIAKNPDSEFCILAAGDVELYRGNLTRSLSYYRHIKSDSAPIRYYATLGYLYLHLGQVKAGRQILSNRLKQNQRELLKGSEDMELAYETAVIYSITGNSKQALVYLSRAIDLGWRAHREARISPLLTNLRRESSYWQLLERAKMINDKSRSSIL